MRILPIAAMAIVGLSVWATVIAQEVSESAKPFAVHLTTCEENVVASELMGEWIADSDIGTRLGGRSDHLGNGPITFRVNNESEQRIITFLNEALTQAFDNEQDVESRNSLVAMQTLYLIGEVEFEGKKQDFAVTSVYGTPRILLYDREGDLESENVMLARDINGDNDVLFLGGDFNNQSFGAFKRKTESSNSGK